MTKEEAYKRIDAFFEYGKLRSELDHSLLYELVDEIFEECEKKRLAVEANKVDLEAIADPRLTLFDNGTRFLELKERFAVAVVGTRTFDKEKEAFAILERLQKEIESIGSSMAIVSGGASGADAIAKKFALSKGLEYIEYPAEWNKYGKRAGFIRNEKIWKEADFGIAFWDGKSRGTAHSFELSKRMKKPLFVWNYASGFSEESENDRR